MKHSKLLVCAILAGLCLGISPAAGAADFTRVSAAEAQREAANLLMADTDATSYIWTDRVTYEPGQSIVLRWTLKPNNDPFPYTLFCYRQNTRTGQKLYLPGLTEQATDIFGRSAQDGFEIVRLTERNKAVLVGPNGLFPAAASALPAEFGPHQFVLEIRDYTATRVLRASYAKFGVVRGSEELTGNITGSRVLTNDKKWVLKGGVFVMPGAVLSIEPGTWVCGGLSPKGYLVVTRGGKLLANGTRANPIVFTSDRPVGQRAKGDWGGISVHGSAPINLTERPAKAELPIDDERADYGGSDPNDNSGIFRYVRVEFGGDKITTENEINGIAFYGVGRGTTVEYVQAHYAKDDGLEFFGGTVDTKYYVSTTGGDDYFDWTFGWTGRAQFIVGQGRGDESDSGFESDNNEFAHDKTPRSSPQIYNVTLIGDPLTPNSTSGYGMHLRRGTAASIHNAIIMGFGRQGLNIDDAATFAQADAGNLKLSGFILWQNSRMNETFEGQFPNAATETPRATLEVVRNKFSHIYVMNPMLRRPYDLSDPDWRPLPNSPAGNPGWVATPPDDLFFDTSVRFLGGIDPLKRNWVEEWTNLLQDDTLQAP